MVRWRDLDEDVLQPRQIEQMAGELAAGPGQIRPLGGVLPHRPAHPPLGAKHETEQEGGAKREEDGHVGYVVPQPQPWKRGTLLGMFAV